MDFDRIIDILAIILSISLLLCFVRLYLGPNLPNRTVAFDAIAVHAVGIVALIAIRNDSVVLLDVAIVTAVLGFLGTTMLARYLEKSGFNETQTDIPSEVRPRQPTERTRPTDTTVQSQPEA